MIPVIAITYFLPTAVRYSSTGYGARLFAGASATACAIGRGRYRTGAQIEEMLLVYAFTSASCFPLTSPLGLVSRVIVSGPGTSGTTSEIVPTRTQSSAGTSPVHRHVCEPPVHDTVALTSAPTIGV